MTDNHPANVDVYSLPHWQINVQRPLENNRLPVSCARIPSSAGEGRGGLHTYANERGHPF